MSTTANLGIVLPSFGPMGMKRVIKDAFNTLDTAIGTAQDDIDALQANPVIPAFVVGDEGKVLTVVVNTGVASLAWVTPV